MSVVQLDKKPDALFLCGDDAAQYASAAILRMVLPKLIELGIDISIVDASLGSRIQGQADQIEAAAAYIAENRTVPVAKCAGRTSGNKGKKLAAKLTELFGYPVLPKEVPSLVIGSTNAKCRKAGQWVLERGSSELTSDVTSDPFPFTPETPLFAVTPAPGSAADGMHYDAPLSGHVKISFGNDVLFEQDVSKGSPFQIWTVSDKAIREFLRKQILAALNAGQVPVFVGKTTVLTKKDGRWFEIFKELMCECASLFADANIELPEPYYNNSVPDQDSVIIDAIEQKMVIGKDAELNGDAGVRYVFANRKDGGGALAAGLNDRKQGSKQAVRSNANVRQIRFTAGTGEHYAKLEWVAPKAGTLVINVDGELAGNLHIESGASYGIIYNDAEDVRMQAELALQVSERNDADEVWLAFGQDEDYFWMYWQLLNQMLKEERFAKIASRVEFMSFEEVCIRLNEPLEDISVQIVGGSLNIDLSTDGEPARQFFATAADSVGYNLVDGEINRQLSEFSVGSDIENWLAYLEGGELYTDVMPGAKMVIDWLEDIARTARQPLVVKLAVDLKNAVRAARNHGFVSPLLAKHMYDDADVGMTTDEVLSAIKVQLQQLIGNIPTLHVTQLDAAEKHIRNLGAADLALRKAA